MSGTANIDVLEAFIVEEAAMLDEARYDDWLGLFTEKAWYWAPHRPDQPDPFNEVSIFYDDRMLLETRVRRLMAQNSHAQSPPARTVRVLGRSRIIEQDDSKSPDSKSSDSGDHDSGDPDFGDADHVLATRFTMVEARLGEQKTWAGTYTHGLAHRDGRWRIAWKRVDLVNADASLDGISIPF